MPAPEAILDAVAALSESTGEQFAVSDTPVEGTQLYVVYSADHPLSELYTESRGMLGFRVPATYPNAQPEDLFFIRPHDVKLRHPDPVRNSIDVHRTGATGPEFLRGTELGIQPTLVFSWHLWDRVAWDRSKHILADHHAHCMRRFDAPEHD